MPDPKLATDLLGLGKIGEKAIDVTATFLDRIFGPAADALGGTLADPVEAWRQRRRARVGAVVTEATGMLERAGHHSQKVPGRILFPILEKSSVEDEDDGLKAKWAALLANAGDMSQTTQVLPAFATILSELGPVEVRILDWYFNNLTGHGTRNTYLTTSGQAMCPINTQTLYFKQFNLDAETAGAIDFNLRRLELIELWDTRSGAVILPEEAKLLPGALPDGTRMFNAQIVTTDNSHRVFTPLGYLFVKACLPPGTPDPQERFRQVGKERHPGQS